MTLPGAPTPEHLRRMAEAKAFAEGPQALQRFREAERQRLQREAAESNKKEAERLEAAQKRRAAQMANYSFAPEPAFKPPPPANPVEAPLVRPPTFDALKPPPEPEVSTKHTFAPRGKYHREIPQVGGSPRYEGASATIEAIEILSRLLGGVTPYRMGILLGVPWPSNCYKWSTGSARPSSSNWVKLFKLLSLHLEEGIDLKDTKTTGIRQIDWQSGLVLFKDDKSAVQFAKSKANPWQPGDPSYGIYRTPELKAMFEAPPKPKGEEV